MNSSGIGSGGGEVEGDRPNVPSESCSEWNGMQTSKIHLLKALNSVEAYSSSAWVLICHQSRMGRKVQDFEMLNLPESLLAVVLLMPV